MAAAAAAKKHLVVVTGASSGIGAATARAFSDLGHPLLLLSRRVEPMEALKLPNAICASVDVTNGEQWSSAVSNAEEKYGPVGALVNNAGCMLLGDPVEQDTSDWDRMINVNLTGVLHGIKVVGKSMKARKSGMIINVSSIAGIKTFPNHTVYCATKYGVRALTECLREEYCQQGVKFVSICPGVVETALMSHNTQDAQDSYKTWKDTLGQVLLPEDVANAIVYAHNQPPHVLVREVVISPALQPA